MRVPILDRREVSVPIEVGRTWRVATSPSLGGSHLRWVSPFSSLSLEDVELKESFLDCGIGENHLPNAVLDPSVPLSLVDTSVSPLHLAKAIALVILVLPFVDVPTSPLEHPKPMLLIKSVVTFVLVALLTLATLPLAFAVLEPIFKLSNVD